MVHIIEHLGRTKLVIDGKSDPKVVYYSDEAPVMPLCPVWKKKGSKEVWGDEPLGKVSPLCAKKNIERLIKDKKYRMFTEERKFNCNKPFVTFGTTEIMMTALKRKIIDAAVTVCDGAGTVITNFEEPGLVQGIGAEMPGLIYTEPIINTIDTITELGGIVLDEEARIDQVEGVERAIKEGYKNIAVSIVRPSDAKILRTIEKKHGINLILMGVHHTGRSPKEIEKLISMLDLIPDCSRKTVPAKDKENKEKLKLVPHPLSNGTKKKDILKAGTDIGMYALTDIGIKLLCERAREANIECP